MEEFSYIKLREKKDIKGDAADWFHSKWGVPKEAYLKCMDSYINGETEYGWYLCLNGEDIVAGLGVIDNDFHDRKDLYPNVCAVYTDENYRGRGIAGKLLNMVVEDMRSKNISPIYYEKIANYNERKLFKIKTNTKEIFYLTIITLIIINPQIIYDIGFLYSSIIVLGIIIFNNQFKTIKYKKIKLSIFIFLISIPINLYNFHYINLLSIIYNLFYIPFISTIIYPFSIMTFFFSFLSPIYEYLIYMLEIITLYLSKIKIFTITLDLNLIECLIIILL